MASSVNQSSLMVSWYSENMQSDKSYCHPAPGQCSSDRHYKSFITNISGISSFLTAQCRDGGSPARVTSGLGISGDYQAEGESRTSDVIGIADSNNWFISVCTDGDTTTTPYVSYKTRSVPRDSDFYEKMKGNKGRGERLCSKVFQKQKLSRAPQNAGAL